MPHTPRLHTFAYMFVLLCRYYAALARNIKLLKLPVFSELFKFPPSFKADLIAYAGAMEQRQAETCSMAVSFHKNTFVRVSPSLGYECVRVCVGCVGCTWSHSPAPICQPLVSHRLVLHYALQCGAPIRQREDGHQRHWRCRVVPHLQARRDRSCTRLFSISGGFYDRIAQVAPHLR